MSRPSILAAPTSTGESQNPHIVPVKASALPKYKGNDVSDVHRVAFLLGRLLGAIKGHSELRILTGKVWIWMKESEAQVERPKACPNSNIYSCLWVQTTNVAGVNWMPVIISTALAW